MQRFYVFFFNQKQQTQFWELFLADNSFILFFGLKFISAKQNSKKNNILASLLEWNRMKSMKKLMWKTNFLHTTKNKIINKSRTKLS
jgi:hypothetical protein